MHGSLHRLCINGNQLAENSPNQMASVLSAMRVRRASSGCCVPKHCSVTAFGTSFGAAADRHRRCGRPGWMATRRPEGVDGLVIILVRLIGRSDGHRSADGYMEAIGLPRSGLSRDLHINSIGVLHMQTGKIPLQGSRTTLCQITRDRFPAETGYPN